MIDDRAGSKELVEWLPPETSLCRLDFGDALIVGNGPTGPVTVGVEVKSIHDLMSSMNTGRLAAHQLPGLLDAYDVTWLLCYGPYRSGKGGALEILSGKGWKGFRVGKNLVPYGYLEQFLFDVQATGCRFKHVYDAEEAARWLACLHRWFSKPWEAHKGLKQFDNSKDRSLLPGLSSEQDLIARVAKELPGIGFDRAQTVAGHFGSVTDMVLAEVPDWVQIPGIGKVIAKAVVNAVRGKNGN